MSKHFTHLHLHTDFSLLDGAISIDTLVGFGKTHHAQALAITDHGNIFGAVKFFQKCSQANIKPILGMEAYFTEDATVRNVHNKYYHLILLVKNEIGYKNLCALIAYSFRKGFYFKPRIDYAILKKHSEGLIATSACLGGHIPKLLLADNQKEAFQKIDWFLSTFGEGNFYLEVQPDEQEEQKMLNNLLYAISKEKGVPLVATGDCHYPSREDRLAHETMLTIQTHDKMDNPERFTFGECITYMRTVDEMRTIFAEHEEAVWNTGIIADQCSFDFPKNKLFFPRYPIPNNESAASYFASLCNKGFDQLVQQNKIPSELIETYTSRLHEEVTMINQMGFPEYFLVVSDFIQWAHQQDIPVGPGRGSVAGSLVAWALQITNIDPIKYNLLFERFLNPERITMPDIDIDFCIKKRDAVINYVKDRYGHDNVSQIITFGTMMAKGVVKDVARAHGIPFEDSNALTSLIPDQLKITLKEALQAEPKLQQFIQENATIKKVFDIAFKLEGLTRHASKHAAGIVISPEPIEQVLPIYIPPKSTDLITQYSMTELEYLGFLKIDLLGLKNLTLIQDTINVVKEHTNKNFSIDDIPLDDPLTYKLISSGKTSGVFQLESTGIKEVLCKLKPEKFEDVIAVNALYRPGPLGSGMVDDFIQRKHGIQKISYLFPELEPILKETYGVIVYQEQVMKIASAIAGYSLGEADILRRAMGKKKADVMEKQRQLFLERSQERNFNGKKAGELFDLMAYFAGYGFNKSHSAAYALIAYQTAYLKAHYPAEFMACLISLEVHNAEKMAFYIEDAQSMGLHLLPPDINRSAIMFTPVDPSTILFGLQGIKNIGQAALDTIINERNKLLFSDLLDFCMRIDLRTANKRVIEHLIWSGALDKIPGTRAQKTAELSTLMEQAASEKRTRATGQLALFSSSDDTTQKEYIFHTTATWTAKETLEKEKEALGLYLSAHPIDHYKESLWVATTPFHAMLSSLRQTSVDASHMFINCGLIKHIKKISTKKGDRMAFIEIEDKQTSAEIVVFPTLFTKIEEHLVVGEIVFAKGTLDINSLNSCKLKATSIVPISHLFQHPSTIHTASLTLHKPFSVDELEALKKIVTKGSTRLELFITEHNKHIKINVTQKIYLDASIVEQIEASGATVALYL
ncbi:MAG: DNA polymerase III subunit alpha [Candidatus Babeliales bacterium]